LSVEEYSELVQQWQRAYYAWNTSSITYYNMIMMNTFNQFVQQLPLITNTHLLAVAQAAAAQRPRFDPMTEIRNSRLKIASMWRRFLAEIIDFVLLHIFKLVISIDSKHI